MKKLKFFKCEHCGNVVVKLVEKGVPVICCGQIMTEINANVVEASTEKHLPVVSLNGEFAEISIGSVAHPMEDEHFINFVAVEFENGYVVKSLVPKQKPEAKIYFGNEKVLAVYEFCNLHGLWKVEL